ncbi:DUF1294 domain-containing protein [Agromyces bauzanensis]
MRLESSPSRGRAQQRSPRAERDLSRPLPAALSWVVLGAFVGILATAVLALGMSWWLPAWYAALSIVAFAAYGFDKASARRSAPRISEQTLLTMGLAGGWPGALVAQQVFRHKTRKRTFRRAFWTTVVGNVLLLAAIVVITTMPALDYPAMLQ